MSLLTRGWITAARVSRRTKRRLRPEPYREELIKRYAPGRTFVDVGGMWGIHADLAFLAEESGAAAVTVVDMMPISEEYRARHAESSSRVRYVQGDLHDPRVLEEVGKHEIVFCAGVLYHAPNPLHTLECLAEITGETLILITASIPEVPGLEQACVFYPGMSEKARQSYVPATPGPRLGITHPFEREGSKEQEHGAGQSGVYDNWWWGITPSALEGMLNASGFQVVETGGEPFATRVIARPTKRPATTSP
jgi:hypothetical protein